MIKMKKLSEDQKKFLCLQRIEGKKIRELAKEWGIGVGTVHKILKKKGISMGEQNSPKSRKRRRKNAETSEAGGKDNG